MKKKPEKDSWYKQSLHVFAQQIWSDEAVIVGTKESLLELREAINIALEKGEGISEHMTSDGEGYQLHVQLLNQHDERWKDLQLPYIDEEAARGNEWKSLNPFDLYTNSIGPAVRKTLPEGTTY